MRNPLIPMLAITGRPDENRINDLTDKYAQCGFDQLMLYPRDGCELEYLSDEWFEAIEQFIKAGKCRNMRFWLYDEYNYPSGGCKGEVMKQGPAFCVNYIKAEFNGERFIPRLCINEKFPNILNPEAVDFFIESTHQQYKKHLGKYFGNEIAGIFTDEPSFYYGVWENDELPYYEGLAEDYVSLSRNDFYTDYDLYYSEKGAESFIECCYKLLAERMYKTYVSRISKWCEKNNLYMTGHLMNDDNPTLSVRSNGDLLKQLSGFSLPAVDDIFSQTTAPRVLMSLSAIQYAAGNKDGAAAELFALGPCDISFSKLKLIIWLTALFGVNNYFLAISHLDVRGNAYRRYYFNDFSPSVPRSFAYAKLGEEAKKASEAARLEYIPDVYIRFPWKNAANGIFKKNSTDNLWGEILKAFNKYQIQYLVIQNEKPQDKPVVDVFTNGFSLDGRLFKSASDIAAALMPEQVYRDANGNFPDDIVIRRFRDKTVLLNLSEDGKTLLLNGKETFLPPFAVKAADEIETEYETLCAVKPNKTVFDRINLSGAVFDKDGKFEFELKENLKITFAIREYPESVTVYSDGKRLIPESSSTVLPDSFNELYCQSAELDIAKGKHTLRVIGDKKHYKYLPDVILAGDFYRQGNVFSSRRFEGTEVKRYGKCTYYFEAEVPGQQKLAIRIKGLSEPVRLYAGGEALGDCIAFPYIWCLPDKYKGVRVCFAAETASDFSPVFGNTAFAEEMDGTPKWCSGFTPSFEVSVPEITAEICKQI